MKKRTMRLLIAAPLLLFLAIQLIPTWQLQTNPPVVAEPDWDSPQTRALAQRSCYACHSNETVWPLYGRVAPVSWLVTRDVVSGRRHLNFSDWNAARDAQKRDKAAEESRKEISRGAMPPSYYIWLHPEAKLTEAEKQDLINGLVATLSH